MILTTAVYKQNDELALPFAPDGVKDRKVCEFINSYEPKFLIKALGKKVALLLTNGITANEQRWLDIRDGVSWLYGTEEVYFEGIVPLIARWVYCYYIDHETTTTTLVAEKKTDAQNSLNVYNLKKHRLWGEMSEGMNDLWNVLYYRTDDDGNKVYPEFTKPLSKNSFRATNRFDIL